MSSNDVAAAIIETHLQLTARALAGSAVDLDVGWSVRTDELPLVWTLNQLCVTEPANPEVIVEAAERSQAHLPYRHVVVRHAPSGEAAAPLLREAQWRVNREVLMAIDATTAPVLPTSEVAELTEDQSLELMEAWLREERGPSEEGVAQVMQYNRQEGRLWQERRFGVLDDGTPLAVTKLRVDGPFGWVEDVYALPRARGKGHGRSLVTHAVREALDAGCSLIAIVADADDWPQHLYASVGFRPVGSAWLFHAESAAAGGRD
jgi:GNAT superfamily N-acetyltransferase